MNLRRLFFIFAGGTMLAVAAPSPPTPAASALIRQRIHDLLQPRRKPESLPVDPPNPFATQTVPAAAPAPEREALVPPPAAVVAEAAGDDAKATTPELLARFASRLRITGMIRLKGQVHVIINDSPWKEGDSIIIERGPRIFQLQVARIQPGQLTLRLDEAELVLRF